MLLGNSCTYVVRYAMCIPGSVCFCFPSAFTLRPKPQYQTIALIAILVLKMFRDPRSHRHPALASGGKSQSGISFLRCLPGVRRVRSSIFEPLCGPQRLQPGIFTAGRGYGFPASPGDPSANNPPVDADDDGGLISADLGRVRVASWADCHLGCREAQTGHRTRAITK